MNKNKRSKKLTLNKETLRSLNEARLGRVVGGGSWACTVHTACVTDCPYCPYEPDTWHSEYTACSC